MSEQLIAPITATRAFELADAAAPLQWDRFIISDAALGTLRRAARKIVKALCEGQDEELANVAARLQFEMAGWLTAPCLFDSEIPRFLRSLLGEVEDCQRRWGKDIAKSFVESIAASEAMALRGSRLRQEVAAEAHRLLVEGKEIRIYCRRADRCHFEDAMSSLGPIRLETCHFIHTSREYRDSPAFDVLLKVGPLRRRGIASTPDALINAPRFTSLVQFVWEGLSDDSDFGVDLFESLLPDIEGEKPSRDEFVNACGFRWRVGTLSMQDDSGWAITTEGQNDELTIHDDLDIASARKVKEPLAKAMLVRLSRDQGVLYPGKANVLCIGPSASAPGFSADWLACEELSEGMFLVLSDVDELEGGTLTAEPGRYAGSWKQLLTEMLRRDREKTIGRLQEAGIELLDIDGAVDHWAGPSTSVIHAPKREQHFMLLMKVLADFDAGWNQALWRLAWKEVGRSRGEAIVAGVVEHEKLRDQVLVALRSITPTIAEGVRIGADFNALAPRNSGLSGVFTFRRINDVESSFRAPEREMRVVRSTSTFRKWLY